MISRLKKIKAFLIRMRLTKFTFAVRTPASRCPYEEEHNQVKETVLQCFYG